MIIKITSDGTSDLTEEIKQKYNFTTIPVPVIIGDEEYKDGVNLTSDNIFEICEKTKSHPRTSAINPSEYKEFFEKIFEEEKCDAIIHFALSSKLSSLCQNAKTASESFDGKVFVIDSQTLSSAIGLQMIYAYELAQQGLEPKQIVEKVEERKNFAQASFVLDTLKYLHKGGRCSRIEMFGANLLKIKPIIALKDGSMDVDSKPRGKFADVVMRYVDYTLEKYNKPDKTKCFITYSTLDDKIVEAIKEKISPIFKEVLITRAGATVATHCGPNTVGILFYTDGE